MNSLTRYLNLLVQCSLIRHFLAECIPSETAASGTHVTTNPRCAGELIFEDNFDNFDLEKWEHDITLSGGGNWEFQFYTNNRSNSYVDSGFFHIKPTLLTDDYGEKFLSSGTLDVNGGLPADQCTDTSYYGCVRSGTSVNYLNSIKSAKIRTSSSFSFRYGRIVIRARMPSGDWLWPAIWMMPRYNSYGKWPSSGEIDIVESRGNKNYIGSDGFNIGTKQVSSTLHWGPFTQVNQFVKTHFTKQDDLGFNKGFHKYELAWSSRNITMYIDDELIGFVKPPEGGFWKLGEFEKLNIHNPWKGSSNMAPFDQKFYLIINLAVGGVNFFSDDNINLGGKPWKNNGSTAYRDFWKGKDQWLPTWNFENDDTHLIVDYVKVYSI